VEKPTLKAHAPLFVCVCVISEHYFLLLLLLLLAPAVQ